MSPSQHFRGPLLLSKPGLTLLGEAFHFIHFIPLRLNSGSLINGTFCHLSRKSDKAARVPKEPPKAFFQWPALQENVLRQLLKDTV